MNCIKAALADKQRSSKWFAEQIGKTEITISRWFSNKSQPSITQLTAIAKILDIDVRELIVSTKNM